MRGTREEVTRRQELLNAMEMKHRQALEAKQAAEDRHKMELQARDEEKQRRENEAQLLMKVTKQSLLVCPGISILAASMLW